MANLCLFLVLFAFTSLEAFKVRNKRDVENDEDQVLKEMSLTSNIEGVISPFRRGENEDLRRGWKKKPGWGKKPCGTLGKPCPTTVIVPPVTEIPISDTITVPTKSPLFITPSPIPTGIIPSFTLPPLVSESDTRLNPSPIPTVTMPSFTKPPLVAEPDSRPTATLPPFITPKIGPITTMPRTPPQQAPTTDSGMIVFPDDDDAPMPRTMPTPKPKPIATPKPNIKPDETIEKEKDPRVDSNPNSTPYPPVVRACMQSCPVTSEFNPICGSDGITYGNSGRLLCAQDCGANVQQVGKGYCRTPPTPAPTVTPPIRSLRECVRKCPLTPEYNPVCGTNGVTYVNPGELLCAQYCGISVMLREFGLCSIVTTSTVRVEPEKDTDDVNQCLLKCGPTSEYDPVCGTNHIIYPSPSRLFCARDCGIKVEILSKGPCPAFPRPTMPTAPPTATTPNPMSTITLSIVTRSCIQRCPSTPEFNPVCGTDMRTYDSPGKLHCARLCGVKVDIHRHGPCIPGRRNRNKISSTTTYAPSV